MPALSVDCVTAQADAAQGADGGVQNVGREFFLLFQQNRSQQAAVTFRGWHF